MWELQKLHCYSLFLYVHVTRLTIVIFFFQQILAGDQIVRYSLAVIYPISSFILMDSTMKEYHIYPKGTI